MHSLFFEIGLVIISASLLGVIGHFLRQPLIIAYILAGIFIGPFGFGLIESVETMHIIAQVGIMLMLFLVGLEMNPSRLKNLGWMVLFVGLGQIIFTGLFGYLFLLLFNFSFIEAFFLAVALTFSSTVIAVKMIYDKKDTHALYAQISIGVLLIQDIVVILALFVLNTFDANTLAFDFFHLQPIFVKIFFLFTFIFFFSRKILNFIYGHIASSNELLILFSLSWCFLVALLSEWAGISLEIGAFIAGLSLASLPYTYEINAKSKVLRDFFITIFFVALGADLVFASLTWNIVGIALLLSFFVLVGNPIIVMILMGLFGYDKKTSFFTGLSIANISEFSVILITMHAMNGHLSESSVILITLIAIITMTISSYFLAYNYRLYSFFKSVLSFFEFKKSTKHLSHIKSKLKNHLILFGYGRMGPQILHQIRAFKDDYLVVDHDNSVVQSLIQQQINCIFGDVEDEELLREVGIEHSEIVISTLPNVRDNLFLITYIKTIPQNNKPILIVTADSGREGFDLFNHGADYVILKPYLGADHIHQINRELYSLEGDLGLAFQDESLSADLENPKTDKDYAAVLHRLNKLRLKEIKDQIKTKKIVLKKNRLSRKSH